MKHNIAEEKRLVAAILCFAVGVFGAHRFYVGKNGTGILQLLTLGGLGVWTFIDFILILFGEFTNEKGEKLVVWN